jgi:hypothetical protein
LEKTTPASPSGGSIEEKASSNLISILAPFSPDAGHPQLIHLTVQSIPEHVVEINSALCVSRPWEQSVSPAFFGLSLTSVELLPDRATF